MIQNANEENAGSSPADPVLVMQAMGRKIGFIPAAARLADPERADAAADLPGRAALLAGAIGRPGERPVARPRAGAIVVVSEGFDVGDLGDVHDAFGHGRSAPARSTVAQVVVNYLNQVGLAAKGAARGNVPGTDQRHSMAYASTVDLDEAYGVRAEGGPGPGRRRRRAASWPRSSASPGRSYNVRYDKVPLDEVANSERTFPAAWITPDGCDVTDDFVRYARPLVGDDMVTLPMVDGRQRLTRLQPIYAAQKLPKYVPQAGAGKAKRVCRPPATRPTESRFRIASQLSTSLQRVH